MLCSVMKLEINYSMLQVYLNISSVVELFVHNSRYSNRPFLEGGAGKLLVIFMAFILRVPTDVYLLSVLLSFCTKGRFQRSSSVSLSTLAPRPHRKQKCYRNLKTDFQCELSWIHPHFQIVFV